MIITPQIYYNLVEQPKVLVMFNVYDGTSTITCKAFLEEKNLINDVIDIPYYKINSLQ